MGDEKMKINLVENLRDDEVIKFMIEAETAQDILTLNSIAFIEGKRLEFKVIEIINHHKKNQK